MLEEVMKDGQRIVETSSLEEVRLRFQEDFAALDDRFKVLKNPPRFPVGTSAKLQRLASEVQEDLLGVNVSDTD